MENSPIETAPAEKGSMGLTTQIFIAMIAGIVLGLGINIATTNDWLGAGGTSWLDAMIVDGLFDAVGKIFVASLKLLVVPLVFVSLVAGVSALQDNSRMGSMAGRALALYLVTTALAITLALMLAIFVQPGHGIDMATASTFAAKEAPPLKDVLINIVPSNPFKAFVEGNMLQVIVFSLLTGFAVSKCGEPGQRIAAFFHDFDAVIMTMVGFLMKLAPYGVFCLLAKLFAGLGVDALVSMSKYVITVVIALLLHGLGVYSLLFKLLTGLNPLRLLNKMRPAMMFAFSTASSGATIPVTLRTVENRVGADNRVAAFTIPLGATINMDGTAIMQGVATVFIAQAFNVDMSVTDYLTVIMTATLASVGTAGVPGVGLITLAMVLQQVGLPVEGIAMIIGVDRLLDMMRTAVNITGDAMITTVVAKKENLLDINRFNSDIEPAADMDVKL